MMRIGWNQPTHLRVLPPEVAACDQAVRRFVLLKGQVAMDALLASGAVSPVSPFYGNIQMRLGPIASMPSRLHFRLFT